MSKRSSLVIKLVASLALLACFGCGGAGAAFFKGSGQGKSPKPATVDPFDTSNVDLKENKGSFSATEKYDPKDLDVPGAQWGKDDSIGSRQKCRKGKKGNACRARNAKVVPHSDAISEQMEDLPWGMGLGSVMGFFNGQVQKSYADQLSSAGGAIEEDHIRSKMLREITSLRNSYVEFTGQRTGFEGSLIEQEFTHNNGESMLMWDAGTHVEYLFFFNKRLWKRMRAFRKDKLNNLSFDEYIGTLTNRFGNGKEIFEDNGTFFQMRWKDGKSYVTAEDRSGFFGVYALIFSARVSQDNLAKLRKNEGRYDGKVKEEVSGMVESVTSGDISDANTSVIDQYTGTSSSDQPSHSAPTTSKEDKRTTDKKPVKKEKEAEEDDDSKDIMDDLF